MTEKWEVAIGIRTIRLDDRVEGTPDELRKRTGPSISEMFKRDLYVL